MSLQDKIRQLPASPGVYLMRDGDGEIIYIGKARSLRQRVRSYFNAAGDSRYQVKFLMARVVDIDVLLTDTEKEALLLENTLIKQQHEECSAWLANTMSLFEKVNEKDQFKKSVIQFRLVQIQSMINWLNILHNPIKNEMK